MSDSAEEHYDLQALLRGFDATWPWAVFGYGTFGADPERNREFLKALPEALGTGAGPTSVSELDAGQNDPAFDSPFNVAFTFGGLSKLGIAPDVLSSFPADFMQGMSRRADKNGDTGQSAPECWEEHWRDGSVDFWIGIYARSASVRDRQHESLKEHLRKFDMPADKFDLPFRFLAGDTQVWIDDSERQPEPDKALEHFGFQDGISNPPIKGLAPAALAATKSGGKLQSVGNDNARRRQPKVRRSQPKASKSKTNARNWQPIAAGEFLYGHLDEIGEIPLGPTPTDIAANGTYMVLRKLSQDVDAFRRYVKELAERHGKPADELAEKMVGRKRNGTPLVKAPPTGDLNDYTYEGDRHGMICPLGSHVRRANPRDGLDFDTLLVDRHRILRRGIPYGKLVSREEKQHAVNAPEDVKDLNGQSAQYPGQGLLFIALNIDIRRQFEFVQSQWLNLGNDLNQGSDRDPIAGIHNPVHPKHNRLVFLTESDEAVVVCPEIPAFVETRGGDYFFLPGLHAYRAILDGGEYC